MALQIKAAKKLDLRGRGQFRGFVFSHKTDNYDVIGRDDSFKIFTMTHINADHTLYFNLDTAVKSKNACFTFINKTEGALIISAIDRGQGDSIIAKGDVAANMINYAYIAANLASTCQIWCDGVNYYHYDLGPNYNTGNVALETYLVT